MFKKIQNKRLNNKEVLKNHWFIKLFKKIYISKFLDDNSIWTISTTTTKKIYTIEKINNEIFISNIGNTELNVYKKVYLFSDKYNSGFINHEN